jgi:phosphate transport system substrate-binding protein
MRRGGKLSFAAGLVALSMLAAACGGNDEAGGGGSSEAGGGGSSEDLSNLTGEVFISGSSTVEPISSLVAELFSEEAPNVEITVEGPGTGDGFELFCNGESDVSDASRPIEEEEIAACEENGIQYTELEVALDGISVLTNPDNSAVTCLNTADLYALTGPESEGFSNWSDANQLGEEIGGIGVPYPDTDLSITAPGEESGTFDAYIELAGFEDIGVERGLSEDEAATTRPDYQSSSNDNVIIDGIAGSPSSFGWVGFSFYEQNQDVVKAIEISSEDESGCVAPSFESIADGSYPLSRSLYIYVNNAKAADSDALSAYVDFYMSETGLQTAVEEVAYVTLPDDRIEATRQTWEDAQAA